MKFKNIFMELSALNFRNFYDILWIKYLNKTTVLEQANKLGNKEIIKLLLDHKGIDANA